MPPTYLTGARLGEIKLFAPRRPRLSPPCILKPKYLQCCFFSPISPMRHSTT